MTFSKLDNEAGSANIGAVFLLLAVVISASLFAFTVTSQGAAVRERILSVSDDALSRSGSTIAAPGPVYVKDVNGDQLIDARDTITLDISVGPAGSPVELASIVATLETGGGPTTVTTSATTIVGDGDTTLERGETVELRIVPPAQIQSGERFAIRLAPSGGAPVALSATMPLISDGLMILYY